MSKILISGGSGFLGSKLIPHLKSKGYDCSILSRKIESGISSFHWDIKRQTIDLNAFDQCNTIIHLAGAGLANKRWTNSYKNEIKESRIKSAQLLFDSLKKLPQHRIQTFISASAIGYYGNTGDTWVEEDFHGTEDFLGEICTAWEKASHQFEQLGIRVVIFRIGLVLDRKEGILPALAIPAKFFLGACLGSGKQFMSWIHHEDLIRMFSHAIEHKDMHGVYNAVAPGPVIQHEFLRTLCSAIHRPLWPFPVPGFLLNLFLGEKASLVLDGQRVSSEKIRMTDFHFQHTDLRKTLSELV